MMPPMNSVPESTDLIFRSSNICQVFHVALNRFLISDERLKLSIESLQREDKKLFLVSQKNTEALGGIHQKLPSLARFLKVFDFTAIYVNGQEFLIDDLARLCPGSFKNLEGPLDRKLRLLQVRQAKAGFYRRLLDSV